MVKKRNIKEIAQKLKEEAEINFTFPQAEIQSISMYQACLEAITITHPMG